MPNAILYSELRLARSCLPFVELENSNSLAAVGILLTHFQDVGRIGRELGGL